jgi:hypothetical protein
MLWELFIFWKQQLLREGTDYRLIQPVIPRTAVGSYTKAKAMRE